MPICCSMIPQGKPIPTYPAIMGNAVTRASFISARESIGRIIYDGTNTPGTFVSRNDKQTPAAWAGGKRGLALHDKHAVGIDSAPAGAATLINKTRDTHPATTPRRV